MATDYAALARQFGGTATSPAAPAPAAPASAPAATPAVDYAAMATQFGGQAEPQKMGFFESVGEMVTGARRATPETQALPEWTGMPELNQLSVASLKSALGTLVSNPQETVQILKANFPGIEARQDAKGNFILKSSVDQKEYAIPPGFSVGDIPRALGGLLAFTPAGRATTLPGAVAAGAGTQAVIEATQAGTGGRFDTGEVVTAGAAGGAGQVVQRAVQAAAPAVKRTVQRATGRPVTPAPAASAAAPAAAPAARIEPTLEPMPAPAAPTAPVAVPSAAPRQINTIDDLFQNPAKFPKAYLDVAKTEIEIPTGLLRATQKDVDPATVSKYVRGRGSFQGSPAEVVLNKETGEYLITDGHHRVAAEILKGNKAIKVELVGEIGQPPSPTAPMAPAAPAGAPIGTAMAPEAAPVAQVATEAFEEVGDLVRKASGSGPGSAAAKAKLADVAQVNPDARAAAERLGMDLPFDVFSDNPQVRAAVGLTRSVAGGEAEAAWVNTVRTAIGKADDVVQQFDAAFIEGRPAPGATSQRILDSLKNTRTQVVEEASDLYKKVDAVVPASFPAETRNLAETLSKIRQELGKSANKNAALKNLEEMVKDGMTYGGVSFEKSMLGATKRAATPNIYSTNLNVGIIKRLEAALAKDQLDTVDAFGGAEVRRQLRAANLLTAKKGALDKRIIGAFGKEADGSVATLMQSAIKSAAKGDAAQFNKLMKVVPPELRKETIATALASVSSSARAGQEGAFGFAEFAKTYRGLRANPPVYKQVIEILGKDADPVLRDLFEISRRITDARAQVLTTGKANQALVEAMKAEGLIGKVMQSTTAQRVVTGAASAIPGGGFVAPDIVQFMSKGNADAVKAAGKLFASDDFQKLAIEAATKIEPSQAAIRRTAASKAFADFANAAKLPQSLDARVQWLQSAVQTGRQFDQENQ